MTRDSDRLPQGENAQRLSAPASQSGGEQPHRPTSIDTLLRDQGGVE